MISFANTATGKFDFKGTTKKVKWESDDVAPVGAKKSVSRKLVLSRVLQFLKSNNLSFYWEWFDILQYIFIWIKFIQIDFTSKDKVYKIMSAKLPKSFFVG